MRIATAFVVALALGACGGEREPDACAALPLRQEAIVQHDGPVDERVRVLVASPGWAHFLGSAYFDVWEEEGVRLFASRAAFEADPSWAKLVGQPELAAAVEIDWEVEQLAFVAGWPHADHHRLEVDGDELVLHVLRLDPCLSESEADAIRSSAWDVRVFAVPAVTRARVDVREARYRMPEIEESGSCARDHQSFRRSAGVGDVLRDGDGYRLYFEGYSAMTGNLFTATSPDGYDWTPSGWDDRYLCTFEGHGPYGDHYGPSVLPTDGDYLAYYGDRSRLLPRPSIARSFASDALTFGEEEIVLPAGEPGTWDAAGVGGPDALAHDGRLFLWYDGDAGDSLSSIGLAISDDGGASFVRQGVVLERGPAGSYDELGVWAPEVHLVGGRFHMWFTAGAGGGNHWRNWRTSIGHAVSDDGIHWTKDERPVLAPERTWERNGLGFPAVLPEGDGYRLWYTGVAGGEPSIGHARCTFD